jgi:hypothetical protein
MLRTCVMGIGVALLVLALGLWLTGHRDGGIAALLIWGVLLAGGLWVERFRYKPELDRPPGPEWMRTGEVTIGPRGTVAVWFDPATGERAYVRE